MSISTRLKKLEEKKADDFVVAWPKYLSADGNRIKWSSAMNEDSVCAIKVRQHVFERKDGEKFRDFEKRSMQAASELLNVSIWLHPAATDA